MVNSSSSLAISCATPPKTRGFGKSYKEIWSTGTGWAFISFDARKNLGYAVRFQYVSGPMRLRVAILVTILAVALTLSAGAHRVSADTPAIQKFDEFGALGHCTLTAHLDNFAIQLEAMPKPTGYIVSYGPEGEGPGSGRVQLPRLKDYMVNARGLVDGRIKTLYGGRNDVLTEPRIQLWIVPAGETFRPEKLETDIDTFKGMFYE